MQCRWNWISLSSEFAMGTALGDSFTVHHCRQMCCHRWQCHPPLEVVLLLLQLLPEVLLQLLLEVLLQQVALAPGMVDLELGLSDSALRRPWMQTWLRLCRRRTSDVSIAAVESRHWISAGFEFFGWKLPGLTPHHARRAMEDVSSADVP